MGFDHVTDEELAGRARDGDPSAFELLVRRHQEGAWRFALAVVGSSDEAEEAVQEAFLRAFRGIRSFRGQAAFRTWLFAICRRACVDLVARRTNVVPLDDAHRVRHPDEHVEDRQVIEETMEAMTHEERSAFVLVDVLGFSREEAARAEEVPASTLKSRLYRARDRLAAALDTTEHQSEMRGEQHEM
jgi:RNA polymerase sigma-70 factor (ECF subfamily)